LFFEGESEALPRYDSTATMIGQFIDKKEAV